MIFIKILLKLLNKIRNCDRIDNKYLFLAKEVKKMINIFKSNEQEKYEIGEELMLMIEKVISECEDEEALNFDNEISLTFTDNENIRQINKDYRDIDDKTDVLSFPMYEIEDLE